jgi:hypothetical protein
MTKKDQDNLARLYVESFENNASNMSIQEIVESNISVALDQLRSPDFNGHALTSHIKNIFDTLDENNIQYDPYEIEPLVIQYIKSV